MSNNSLVTKKPQSKIVSRLVKKDTKKADAFISNEPSESAPSVPSSPLTTSSVHSNKKTIIKTPTTKFKEVVTVTKSIVGKKKNMTKQIVALAMRCSGLTVKGHRCHHKDVVSDKCHCHKKQVGRIMVVCAGQTSTGKACKHKKMLPIYKGDDGSLMFDMYLCKSHRGKRIAANVDDVRSKNKKLDERQTFIDKLVDDEQNIHPRTKVNGIWFYLAPESKCRGCHNADGLTHGYFCSNCVSKARYEMIKRCTGTTIKNHRSRHENKMISTYGDHVSTRHKNNNHE